MKPLYPDEFIDVEIKWTRPQRYDCLLQEDSKHDEVANLYLISARYGTAQAKTLYIGKTYLQWVTKRLSQKDHKTRYENFIENYPHHVFYVSHGIIEVREGNLNENRLDDVERILIYSSPPEHSQNVRNFYEHGVKGAYHIVNKGSRCTLPRNIKLGIFVKK